MGLFGGPGLDWGQGLDNDFRKWFHEVWQARGFGALAVPRHHRLGHSCCGARWDLEPLGYRAVTGLSQAHSMVVKHSGGLQCQLVPSWCEVSLV
jgi:hypothetical protein